MITNTNSSSLQNATLNISGLKNFNQMIDKLIAETESTVIVPVENQSGNETSKQERTSKEIANGQGIAPSIEKDADLILDNKHHEESPTGTNRDSQINNLNVNSKIIYINKTLPHNSNSAENMEIAGISNNFPEFLQSRRSFGGNTKYEDIFKKIFDKPLSDGNERGIVVKEEFSFEIEDDKPIHAATASERMHYNNTFHEMLTPPAVPFRGGYGHNIPFNLPPTPTTTHKNEKTDLRIGKPFEVEKVMMPIPEHLDDSNKLLSELSKMNTKINGVEELLKKSIVKENQVTNYPRLIQNPGMVKSGRSVGLLRTRNPQGVVPYQHTIYHPAQNSIAASSFLSLQKRLVEERARNHLLNLKLEKAARAKQNVALLNELMRAKSRLTLHLPTVFRRILL